MDNDLLIRLIDRVNFEFDYTALLRGPECHRFAELVAEECAKVCEQRWAAGCASDEAIQRMDETEACAAAIRAKFNA